MRTILISLALTLPFIPKSATTVSLSEAVKNQLVEASIAGSNGYTGRCMQVKLTNLHKKPVEIQLAAGLKLISDDSLVQNMIITKSQIIELEKGEAKTIRFYAMCIQQHNMGPSEEKTFALGSMADSLMLELVRFIETKRYYDEEAAQHALWVLTDNASIASIYSENEEVGKSLRLFVSKLTGEIPPWFQVEYKKEQGVVFSNEPAIIHATLEFVLENEKIVNLGLFDEQGQLLQSVVVDKLLKPGRHRMRLNLEAYNVKPGKYFVRLREKEDVLEERVIEL